MISSVAHASVPWTVHAVTTLTPGRIGAMVAAGLGVCGVIIAWLALTRPASRLGTGRGPLGGLAALAAGLLGIAVGAVVVATSDAGIGTGNGRAGAYVAMLAGLASIALGARALARARRVPVKARKTSE